MIIFTTNALGFKMNDYTTIIIYEELRKVTFLYDKR